MRIRPYHVWLFLPPLLAVPAARLADRPRGEFKVSGERMGRWPSLIRQTTEELDREKAHRYVDLAPALKGVRDVGYFSERDKSTLWGASSTPDGHDRIYRYYMAQGILAPAVLRLDETWPRVVVDCATPEQAGQVVARQRLTVTRDFGQGLLLTQPER